MSLTAEATRRTWGETLRAERQRQGLTQEDLAARAGTDQATVSRIEAGANNSLDAVLKIAQALGLRWQIGGPA